MNPYWNDKNILEFDDMLEYLRGDVLKHFYDIFIVKPDIIPTQNWSTKIGWHIISHVHLENGWIIQKGVYVIFFDKDMVLKWNGKYYPHDLGSTFSLSHD